MARTFLRFPYSRRLSQPTLKQHTRDEKNEILCNVFATLVYTERAFGKKTKQKHVITPLPCIRSLGQWVWSSKSLSAPCRCLLAV